MKKITDVKKIRKKQRNFDHFFFVSQHGKMEIRKQSQDFEMEQRDYE